MYIHCTHLPGAMAMCQFQLHIEGDLFELAHPFSCTINTFLQFISPCMSSGVGAVKESPCRNFYSILMMSVNSALLHKHPLSELGVYCV